MKEKEFLIKYRLERAMRTTEVKRWLSWGNDFIKRIEKFLNKK